MTEPYTGEWTPEEWRRAWNIRVGKAYRCGVCGTMVMATRGGVGNLEPRCCDRPMQEVRRPETEETGS